MALPSWTAPLLAAIVAGVLLVGCGGGDSDTPARGGGRLTDPATAPTATPNENPGSITYDGDQVISASGVSTLESTPGPEVYIVQSGDTCGSIATRYEISLDELLAANPWIDADCLSLAVNDTVQIPMTAEPTPEPGDDGETDGDGGDGGDDPDAASGETYTVEPGDICGSIADQFGVSVDELIAANGLDADCLGLSVGQVLVIP